MLKFYRQGNHRYYISIKPNIFFFQRFGADTIFFIHYSQLRV